MIRITRRVFRLVPGWSANDIKMKSFFSSCSRVVSTRSFKVWLALSLGLMAIPGYALELRTAAQDSAPKYQMIDGTMQGIGVDIMRALEAVDSDLKFVGDQQFLPFRRLQRDLELGSIDVFFGLKRTAKRDALFRFIEEPLYRLNYTIAMRKDDLDSINSIEDLNAVARDDQLATVRGAATRQFLVENFNARFIDSLPSPAQLLRVLEAGRIRFAFYHDMGLENAVRSQKMESSLTVLPVSFSSYGHHVAFNRNVPQASINRVETALEKIRADGTLASILGKYGLRVE